MAADEYGMTAQGFVPKRLVDINADIVNRIAGITDPKTGTQPFMDVADDSIIGQIVGIVSNAISECWEAAYEASVQFNPLYNTGAGQSGTVQLNGITRQPGGNTIIRCTLTGKEGTTIPEGALIGDMEGTYSYALNASVVIPSDGEVSAAFTCTTKAENNPEPGTVNTIQTAVMGWYGVVNTETLSVGQPEESDAALRKRQQQSTSLTSYRQIEAIYAAILAVQDVTFCRVYQNAETSPEDSRGIPFKEIAPIVVGGDDNAIAEAMFLRMPVTVQGYGSTIVTLTDQQGISYPVAFSRPTEVPIYVAVDISVTDSSLFPSNYASLIQQAIVEYAYYDNTAKSGFPPGSDVIRTRLFTPINAAAPGFRINNMTIGKSAEAQAKDDIQIAWNEVAQFVAENITVTLQD